MAEGTSGGARSAAPPGAGRSGELDARVRRSRSRVLATAFELLSESGVGGFSVDEVARRSGVAKTTIYRQWPTREALVLDACSRISAEQGKTWGPEIILRNDGGCWDLGYSRSVQRPDGKIVTVYYFNDSPEHERQIAATIWDPR